MSDCFFCAKQVIDYKLAERYTSDGLKIKRIACDPCYDVFDAIMTVCPSFAKWDAIPTQEQVKSA